MKGDYFQDEKLKYEDIEVPDELLFMVRRTVAADRRKKAAVRRRRILKTAASVAAVWFLCLTIGVNSSYAFAEAAVKIPVVKGMAQAVVIRSYRSEITAVYEEHKTGWRTEKEPEEVPEKQPEAVLAENEKDNNPQVLADTAGQEISEQTEDKTLQGPDGWKAEMTSEKLREVTELYTPEMEETYADTPEKLNTILLAELADKDIALYGYHEDGTAAGVALRVGDICEFYNWIYMNDSKELPEISCADADGDGEEEIVVFLYNGELMMQEISKEDITAPEKGAEQNKSGNAVQINIETKKTENTGEISATDIVFNDNAAVSDTSGNNIEKSDLKSAQIAGEIWVIDLKGENWSANVLSVDDYESQILHQLKAAYDGKTGEIQLYLMEKPLGEPVKLPAENLNGLTYEAINLAPARTFTTEQGISIQFRTEASFLNENMGRIVYLLDINLKADIHLEADTLIVGNIVVI